MLPTRVCRATAQTSSLNITNKVETWLNVMVRCRLYNYICKKINIPILSNFLHFQKEIRKFLFKIRIGITAGNALRCGIKSRIVSFLWQLVTPVVGA